MTGAPAPFDADAAHPAPAASAVIVPVLPVADLVRSAAWYERLGFRVQGAWDDYVILDFEGAEVHLTQLAAEAVGQPSWSGAYLRVADADALHARWIALGAPEVAPPTDRDHAMREFATQDLDNNLWRVGSPLTVAAFDDADPDVHRFDGTETEPTIGATGTATATASAPADELASARADVVASSPLPVGDRDASADEDHAEAGPGTAVANPVTATDGGPGTTDDAWLGIVQGDRPCAGCGFRPAELPARALGAEARDLVHEFGRMLLAADDDDVRARPDPAMWTALEYGVHVRDVLRVYADRIVRTLAQDHPELAWYDQEAAIADGMANESDVGAVADDMGRNASHLSEALRQVTEDDWDRSATRTSPFGTQRFTIELLARFAVHEVVHHRADAERSLAAARTR